MSLTKKDLQEVVGKSEKRIREEFTEKIEGVEERLEQKMDNQTEQLAKVFDTSFRNVLKFEIGTVKEQIDQVT